MQREAKPQNKLSNIKTRLKKYVAFFKGVDCFFAVNKEYIRKHQL